MVEEEKTQANKNSSDKPKYCLRDNQKVIWRYWQGDYVVFNSLSGETHALDIVSGRALERILDQPATLEDIRATIASFLEVESDTELANAVDQILFRLEDAGLIEAAS